MTHLVFYSHALLCWLLEKLGFSQFVFPKTQKNEYYTTEIQRILHVVESWLYSHDL